MKTLIFILIGVMFLSTNLLAPARAPVYREGYIIVHLFDGEGGYIVISPEEAMKQRIDDLPRRIVLEQRDLKRQSVVWGISGKPINKDKLHKYLARELAGQ